ncbi:hypothetical protein [Caloranaerobacter azorensis]|uniref:hypothetical protein n=1 Tax=Caloranaerobacter azorensis TaxID=116090 RepID=UPI000932943E|nr:hypothetical protein [Caloranaerobacter azorensis]
MLTFKLFKSKGRLVILVSLNKDLLYLLYIVEFRFLLLPVKMPFKNSMSRIIPKFFFAKRTLLFRASEILQSSYIIINSHILMKIKKTIVAIDIIMIAIIFKLTAINIADGTINIRNKAKVKPKITREPKNILKKNFFAPIKISLIDMSFFVSDCLIMYILPVSKNKSIKNNNNIIIKVFIIM